MVNKREARIDLPALLFSNGTFNRHAQTRANKHTGTELVSTANGNDKQLVKSVQQHILHKQLMSQHILHKQILFERVKYVPRNIMYLCAAMGVSLNYNKKDNGKMFTINYEILRAAIIQHETFRLQDWFIIGCCERLNIEFSDLYKHDYVSEDILKGITYKRFNYKSYRFYSDAWTIEPGTKYPANVTSIRSE